MCPQMDLFHKRPFVGGEDCLYLNIHVPEVRFLVLVFNFAILYLLVQSYFA